jgi:hypothetical protein
MDGGQILRGVQAQVIEDSSMHLHQPDETAVGRHVLLVLERERICTDRHPTASDNT